MATSIHLVALQVINVRVHHAPVSVRQGVKR